MVAFEPDPVECGRLNKQSWPYDIRFLPNALGSQDGTSATLHITKKPGCSSLLKPNYDLCNQFEFGSNMEIVGQYPMTLSRLDTVCDVQPDMLKVDTQGTELDILQGAGRLLDRVMAVELEVEFVPQYEGQALFADIDAFMRSKGFMLRGLRRTSWRQRAPSPHAYGGQLIHGDVSVPAARIAQLPRGTSHSRRLPAVRPAGQIRRDGPDSGALRDHQPCQQVVVGVEQSRTAPHGGPTASSDRQ